MPILVRRSNLLVSIADADAVADAWRHNADAITLSLDSTKPGSLDSLKEGITAAGQGAAEVFVRVRRASLQDDLEHCVWRGLSGIVLPNVASIDEIVQAAEILASLEKARELAAGSLGLIVLLGSARGVWNIRPILKASARVSQTGLDERALAESLGIDPHPDYDPFVYARGRLAVEATAARVGAVGMAYPMSVRQQEDAAESEIHAMATKAKNLGMKGVICPHASWVAPVNAAFTPTPELVAYNKRVREAFAAGVTAGTAAVPLDGRMIDVPVDEWAIVVLATAEACARRDSEKKAASRTKELGI
ncbi:MAG TPA: aldolase/citrate lyase family protein [Burkholderiales bacterium]|nr:aldolase/citrate lyase family protein [Burkholderiales bacterium]